MVGSVETTVIAFSVSSSTVSGLLAHTEANTPSETTAFVESSPVAIHTMTIVQVQYL